MVRLLVYMSTEHGISFRNTDYGNILNWYSEGLLSSPFLARPGGDKLAEGYTHTDIALGDCQISFANNGAIKIIGDKGIFCVIEAKMGSKLSTGTKNAPNYNQASRNLACIAYNTISTKHRIQLVVVAPEKKIIEHKIENQVNLQVMLDQIAKRFDMYPKDSKVFAKKEKLLERASQCSCKTISYESWINAFTNHNIHEMLEDFKTQCYKFNRID